MKKNSLIKIFPLLGVFFLGACQPSLYEWGSYDSKLLNYYKDVSHLDAFEAELFALIEQTGTSEKPLAPGIYAEYGFLQMQKGDMQAAVKFFKMEKKVWPESTVLMDVMIRSAGGDPAKEEKETADLTPMKKG